jgi:hypothetical protein
MRSGYQLTSLSKALFYVFRFGSCFFHGVVLSFSAPTAPIYPDMMSVCRLRVFGLNVCRIVESRQSMVNGQ